MSGLILPAWLTNQPKYAAAIESKNPLCNGLRYVVSGAEPWINLVDRKAKASTTGSGLVMASGPSGKKVTAGASNGAHAWNGINADSRFTVAMVARDTVTGAYRMPFAVIDGGSNNVFFLRYGNPNDVEFRVYDNVGNDSAFITVGTVSSAQTSVIVGTVDAGRALALYYNGRLQSSVAAAAVTANPILATQNVRLGSNNGEDFAGEIYLALIWSRTLSANEVKAFSLNPWQVLKAPTRRLWFGASASGSTYNVDAADSITATDAATQQLTAPAAAADAATATDSATNLGVLVRSASDAAAASDSASNALTIAASTTDAASATDSATSASAVNSAATDAITATDAATQLAVLPAAASDSVSAADAASNIATMPAAATDAATATDSATGLRITTAAATDAATATDSASQVNAVNVAANDAISAADAATVQAVLAGIVSDGFSAVDAATLLAGIYNVTAADVLSLLDAAAADGGAQYTRAPAGWAQPLIEPTGHRAPVISGSRPGNINTSRPANRGGRRT